MKQIDNYTYTLTLTVEKHMLANAVGSGDVAVYATPMMIASMEECAKKCLQPYLEDGETSVGIMIHASHESATPLHKKVSITAKIEEIEGRIVTFHIEAKDEISIIGKATHQRCIVHKDTFENRVKNKYNK